MVLRIRRRCVLVGVASLLALSCPSLAAAASALPDSGAGIATGDEKTQTALATYIASTYRKPLEYVQRIVHVTFNIAKRYSLPPNLLLAIMAKESAFDPNALSPRGATGLMQVIPRFHLTKLEEGETARSFREPHTNIRVAADILTSYLDEEGTLDRALNRYSGGARGYSQVIRRHWVLLDAAGPQGPA